MCIECGFSGCGSG
jgi:hypothetical protein